MDAYLDHVSPWMPVVIQQWIVNHDHVSAERDAFTERRTPLLIHGSTGITRD